MNSVRIIGPRRHLFGHVVTPKQLCLDRALLNGLAVSNLVVVELLRCHGHLPGILQFYPGRSAYRVLDNLHGLDASIDREYVPDLLLSPALREALDEDARAHRVLRDDFLIGVLIILLRLFLWLLSSFVSLLLL